MDDIHVSDGRNRSTENASKPSAASHWETLAAELHLPPNIDFGKSVHGDKFNYAGPANPVHEPQVVGDRTSQVPEIPQLPDRYLPIQEDVSGQKATGISREFLKNLDVDRVGTYYGAGLQYPDVVADPEMNKYLQDQNQISLSKIDKGIYDQEVADEKKAAAYKLPPDWDSSSSDNLRPLNSIDLKLGGNGSMTVGSHTFTLTEDGAPHRKLVEKDASAPGGSRTVIPEPKDFVIEQVIQGSTANGQDKSAVIGSKDGASVLYVYDSNGKQESQIQLPGYGTLHDARQGSSSSEVQFLYDTPISTPRVVTLDLNTDKAEFSPLSKDVFNTDNFVTDKFMVPYSDREGKTQEVPVYVSHNKDIKFDGKNPAMLEIYGGFNIAPQWLKYYPHSASWLEHGGVVVDPILPGDGGLGDNNYHAGLAQGIENTDLALVAAAKKVQDLGLSSPETTGVYGRSNGGMIVNSTLNMRPDVFGAAVSESGVNSLLDSPTVNVDTGRYWQDEFGDPTDASQAAWMSKLDVINNLSADKHYPATLIEIGTKDGVVNVGNGITVANIRQKMNNGETLLYSRFGEGHDPSSLDLQTAFLWDRLSHPNSSK